MILIGWSGCPALRAWLPFTVNTQCAPRAWRRVGDVLAPGVQCVCGDHHTGEVDTGQGVQQRRERGNLVGLTGDLGDLGDRGLPE
jgi:hypothetical protein